MYRLILLALLAVAGCAAKPVPPAASYRNTALPVYSNAVLDSQALQGDWQQVAAFAAQPGGCAPGAVRFGAPQGGALPLQARLCLGGQEMRFAGQATLPMPGRLQPQGADPRVAGALAQPWWVLWADVNLRTLVIGTPSGEMGFILNRDGPLPPDRLTAAREILDWNGYDLSRLQRF